jgi:dTDP-4-amino-4,6-dideoxygalactose transaminase
MYRDHGRETKYTHEFAASNERLDTLQAAILRVKLRRLDDWNAHRRAVAEVYARHLADIPEVTLPEVYPESIPVWHLYVIRAQKRDDLEQYLNDQGIGTGRHYPLPLHMQPSMKEGYREGDFPHAERACREILSLPMYPHLGLDQADQVARVIRMFYGRG